MIIDRSAAVVAALLAAAVAGCRSDAGSSSTGGAADPAGGLRSGMVARVGSLDIPAASVARIASAQKLDLRQAREAAVREALFANEGRARGLEADPSVRSVMQAALARRLINALHAEAKRAGAATDAELAEVTKLRWLDLDRPEGFRVVHAVVRLDQNASAARRKDALSIAEAVRRALDPLSSSPSASSEPSKGASVEAGGGAASKSSAGDPLIDEFTRIAGAVPHEGFEVVVEALPPVTADGRVIDPSGASFDPDFARAASELGRRGELSPLTVSSFGVHVMMLLERTPARVVPIEERRERVRDEVVAWRARAAMNAILERSREDASVDRSVDALLALVPVDQ